MNMTDAQRKAIQKILKREGARKVTRESALKRLIEGGFLTPSGELSPNYGGPESPSHSDKVDSIAA